MQCFKRLCTAAINRFNDSENIALAIEKLKSIFSFQFKYIRLKLGVCFS